MKIIINSHKVSAVTQASKRLKIDTPRIQFGDTTHIQNRLMLSDTKELPPTLSIQIFESDTFDPIIPSGTYVHSSFLGDSKPLEGTAELSFVKTIENSKIKEGTNKDNSVTHVIKELEQKLDGKQVYVAPQKSLRLPDLAKDQPIRGFVRVLSVDEQTGDVQLHLIDPKNGDINEPIDIGNIRNNPSFTQATIGHSLDPQDQVVTINKEDGIAVQLDTTTYDVKDYTTTIDGREYVSVYYGSTALHVEKAAINSEPVDGTTVLQGAKPTHFVERSQAWGALNDYIGNRTCIGFTGSTTYPGVIASMQGKIDNNNVRENHFESFYAKSHENNITAEAESLWAAMKKNLELLEAGLTEDDNGQEVTELLLITASLDYHGFPSADRIMGEVIMKNFTAWQSEKPDERKDFGCPVLNISDQNSRRRDGVAWQMPYGTDFVVFTDNDDTSNDVKELLMINFSKLMITGGGGRTVSKLVIRCRRMGVPVLSIASSNTINTQTASSRPVLFLKLKTEEEWNTKIDEFKKEVDDQLEAEKKRENNLLQDKDINGEDFTITIVGSYAQAIDAEEGEEGEGKLEQIVVINYLDYESKEGYNGFQGLEDTPRNNAYLRGVFQTALDAHLADLR